MSDKPIKPPAKAPKPVWQRWWARLKHPRNEQERLWRNTVIALFAAVPVLGVSFCLRDTGADNLPDVQAASWSGGAVPLSEAEAENRAWQTSEQQVGGMIAPAEDPPNDASGTADMASTPASQPD